MIATGHKFSFRERYRTTLPFYQVRISFFFSFFLSESRNFHQRHLLESVYLTCRISCCNRKVTCLPLETRKKVTPLAKFLGPAHKIDHVWKAESRCKKLRMERVGWECTRP